MSQPDELMDQAQVRHVAKLSRLKLTDQELRLAIVEGGDPRENDLWPACDFFDHKAVGHM